MRKLLAASALGLAAAISISACGGSPATPTTTSGPPIAQVTVSTPPSSAPVSTPSPVTVTFRGHGHGSTPVFSTTGDFSVSWSFKGNADVTQWADGKTSSPDNFSASMYSSGQTEQGQTGQDLNWNDPDEIQVSDSGNQTISGDDGTHYFTVDAGATSSWVFSVTSGG